MFDVITEYSTLLLTILIKQIQGAKISMKKILLFDVVTE
jgi:hypothetical protein